MVLKKLDFQAGFPSKDVDEVTIPESMFTLNDDHLQQLKQQVDPLAQSDNNGIELYKRAVYFIHQVVSNNPLLYND